MSWGGREILTDITDFCDTVMKCGGKVKRVCLDETAFNALRDYMVMQMPIIFPPRIKEDGTFIIHAAGYSVFITRADSQGSGEK